METCENCGTPIGKMETAHVWKGATVCAPCHHRMSHHQAIVAAPASHPTTRRSPVHELEVANVRPQPQYQPPRVQTIEKTGKQWKGMGCLGAMMLFGGTIMAISGGAAGGNPAIIGFGILLGIVGAGVALVARIGAWWYHG